MAITKVTSSVLSSGSATDGYVLTADGSGNSAWEAAAGGGVDGIVSSADATAITIDSNENVGIGTSNPASKLHVSNGSAGIQFAPDGISDGISFLQAYDWVANTYDGLRYYANEHYFYTGNNERMRISSAGQLIIGNTSAVNTTTGLDVNNLQNGISSKFNSTYGTCFMAYSGNNNGLLLYGANASAAQTIQIESDGDIKNTNNSYGALSDVKLKENIVNANPQLDKLKQVQVRNYNLIGEELRQIGMVAQELETIYPNLVTEIIDRDKNAEPLETTTKTIKYSVFVPILIKAMQEQQTIIEDLQARIETLENA